jgi:triacylglycerol lipase
MIVVEHGADGKLVMHESHLGRCNPWNRSFFAPTITKESVYPVLAAARQAPMSTLLTLSTSSEQRVPRLRAPIVLVHGLFGFDSLRLGPWLVAHYFQGIPEALRRAGNRVLVASLSPTGGIADRARQLKELLDRESPHEPVHLIAHSMGGLDSRYLISRLGMAHRVLTLTTLGTPHRGSAFADWGLHRLQRVLQPLFNFANVPYQAFFDLTTAHCADFNRQTPDAPGVRYFSVAGDFQLHWLTPEWQIPARILSRTEGPNDGVVSVASSTWGEQLTTWDGDHLNLINWKHSWVPARRQIDRTSHYGELVRRLADEDF